jgi:hypothetical protein
MAEIPGVTFIFTDYDPGPGDPRVIFIPNTIDDASVSDLIDTFAARQADLDNLIFDPLMSAGGTEDLGGGVAVAKTLTNLNLQIAFKPVRVWTATGTITTTDTTGQLLTDTGADFVAASVRPGASVINFRTGAIGTVFRIVDTQNLLLLDALGGGVPDQEWQSGDTYRVINTRQVTISGGNDVAVDNVDAELPPILPTVFTQVVRAASSSATLVGGGLSIQGIVDGVWDEVNTGLTHNVQNSTGKQLRQVKSLIIRDGTAQGGTINTITLDAAASSVDGQYDPAQVTIIGNTGADQARQIIAYDGTTKIAAVDRDWRVTPDATSEFVIQAVAGSVPHVNEGLAQSATANTIGLNDNASSVDDTYIEQIVVIRSGKGAHQARRVTGYNGTTKVAQLIEDWTEIPDATSGYVMLHDSDGALALAFLMASRDEAAGTIEIKAWGSRGAAAAGFAAARSAPVSILIEWFDEDGTLLFSLTEANAITGPPAQNPDAQDVYAFTVAQVLADDRNYYAVVTVVDGAGVISNRVPIPSQSISTTTQDLNRVFNLVQAVLGNVV